MRKERMRVGNRSSRPATPMICIWSIVSRNETQLSFHNSCPSVPEHNANVIGWHVLGTSPQTTTLQIIAHSLPHRPSWVEAYYYYYYYFFKPKTYVAGFLKLQKAHQLKWQLIRLNIDQETEIRLWIRLWPSFVIIIKSELCCADGDWTQLLDANSVLDDLTVIP